MLLSGGRKSAAIGRTCVAEGGRELTRKERKTLRKNSLTAGDDQFEDAKGTRDNPGRLTSRGRHSQPRGRRSPYT